MKQQTKVEKKKENKFNKSVVVLIILLMLGIGVSFINFNETAGEEPETTKREGSIYSPKLMKYAEKGWYRYYVMDYIGTIDIYNKTLHIQNNSARVQERIGWDYYKKNQFNMALKHFKKAASISHYGSPYRGQGWAHYELGNAEKAKQNFQKAIELSGNTTTGHEGLGVYYYYMDEGKVNNKSRQFSKAAKKFKLLTNLEPQKSRYYVWLGWAYFRLNKLGKAKMALTNAKDLNNQAAEAYRGLAWIDYRQNNSDEALLKFKKALTLLNRTRSKQAFKNYSSLNKEKHLESISNSYIGVGFINFKKRNYSKAIMCLQKSKELAPDYFKDHNSLKPQAKLHWAKARESELEGKYDLALKEMEKCLAINFSAGRQRAIDYKESLQSKI